MVTSIQPGAHACSLQRYTISSLDTAQSPPFECPLREDHNNFLPPPAARPLGIAFPLHQITYDFGKLNQIGSGTVLSSVRCVFSSGCTALQEQKYETAFVAFRMAIETLEKMDKSPFALEEQLELDTFQSYLYQRVAYLCHFSDHDAGKWELQMHKQCLHVADLHKQLSTSYSLEHQLEASLFTLCAAEYTSDIPLKVSLYEEAKDSLDNISEMDPSWGFKGLDFFRKSLWSWKGESEPKKNLQAAVTIRINVYKKLLIDKKVPGPGQTLWDVYLSVRKWAAGQFQKF